MTTDEWLDLATAHAEKLKSLLHTYHPANLATRGYTGPPVTITAPGAEAACANVRRHIQQNWEGDPEKEFDEALAARNVSRVYKLLSDAWFGRAGEHELLAHHWLPGGGGPDG